MTILFFMKPYQFFDRGGYVKKHVEDAKEKKERPAPVDLPEPLQLEAKKPEFDTKAIEVLHQKRLKQAEAEERWRKDQERIAEARAKEEARLEAIRQAKIVEERRIAREKAEREYQAYLEKLRLEAIERERIREEKRVIRAAKHRKMRAKVTKIREERERIRLEIEESDIREIIMVINQHLEDNPY